MSWGTRKRNFILLTFFTIVFIILGAITFLIFYQEPTCFDNKQNGNETGIDCGGSCDLLCSTTTVDPIVHWVRYFKIADGLYSVIAYIENQNTNAIVKNLPYSFKLYDDKGVNIAEKTGRVNLNPRQIIPIAQTGLSTGELTPIRVSFDFTDEIIWQKEEPQEPSLIIKDEQIVPDTEVQKITAEVFNTSLEDVRNVTFVVIVYNKDNNAIASSSTLIDEIRGSQSTNLLFTWPTNFTDEISRFEIIPVYQ
jgi:hypothetical protein